MKTPEPPWRYDWKPDATDMLTAIWLDARDRERLTEASAEIDAALGNDPSAVGESQFALEDVQRQRADVRLAFFGPLMVTFALSAPRREVMVNRHHPRPPRPHPGLLTPGRRRQ